MSNALRLTALVFGLTIGAGGVLAEDTWEPSAARDPAERLSMPAPVPVPIERQGRPVAPLTNITNSQALDASRRSMPERDPGAALDARIDALLGALPAEPQ